MLTQPTEQKYTVAQAQIAQFQQKGYTCLRGIIKPENFAHFKKQMNEAIDKIKTKGDIQDRIDDYSNIFTQVTNIWRVDPETKDFILCRVFGDIAAQLLGVDKVRIYHDQALVKFPKAGKTVWHQDCFYWPIDSPKSITMWMPLHDCPKSMGTMQFVSGSHTNEQIILHPISQTSEAYYSNLIKQKNLETESYDLKAGDATFHAGHTVHCAYPNGQLGKREVITIIYFEDGAKVMQEDQLNQFRKVDLKVFCPGVKPEEKIESELNPIIN